MSVSRAICRGRAVMEQVGPGTDGATGVMFEVAAT